MIKWACFFIPLAVPFLTLSQNVLDNGNFEKFEKCPSKQGQIKKANGWYSPSKSKATYYHECNNASLQTLQKGYCGLYLPRYSSKDIQLIQTELLDSLEKGKRYTITLKVYCPKETYLEFNSVGCLLSSKKNMFKHHWNPLKFIGTNITLTTDNFEQSEWIELKGNFLAKGIENYLTVGRFYQGKSMFDSIQTNSKRFYYYIDDINIELDTMRSNNLICNGGFEDYTFCGNSISYVSKWNELDNMGRDPNYSGNKLEINMEETPSGFKPLSLRTYLLGSPDYYNVCLGPGSSVSYINSKLPKPHNGNGYAGLNLANKTVKQRGAEYLQGQLLTPLVEGQVYAFQMYVKSAGAAKYISNTLGVYFSPDLIGNRDVWKSDSLEIVPQINTGGKIIHASEDWVSITGSFIAKGGEKYFTIGDFNHSFKSEFKTKNGNSTTCYYYIDEVSLRIN
jgi:hypothetical protein